MTLSESRILLVDDEPVLRSTCGIVLRRAGATVTEAANGAEALQLLRRQVFDLVLTDLHMPVMDGGDLLRALAQDGFTLPAVLCAGTIVDEDAPLPNVAATLLKPFAPAELLRVLHEVLLPLPLGG